MNIEAVKELVDSTLQNFKGDNGSLKEFYPPKSGDRNSCFLWSYFATTGMLYRGIKAGLPLYDSFKELIEGLVYYKDSQEQDGSVKYHSERGVKPNCGSGPCFFDDNIWVARNLLFAYDIFKDEKYLQEAQKVTRFVYSGWDNDLGGLYWNENGLTNQATVQDLERGLSANACAIIVNAILYRLTGQKSYLDWALKFYAFCKSTQDKDTKIYYNGVHTCIENGVRQNGEINKDLYSYNTGSMILADLELYNLIGDIQFFEDAKRCSKAAYEAFVHKDQKSDALYIKDFVWFTAVLAEGWNALANEGSKAERDYLKMLAESVGYSIKFKHPAGLLPHDLVLGWRKNDDYDRMLLTHSGIAEIAVIAYLGLV